MNRLKFFKSYVFLITSTESKCYKINRGHLKVSRKDRQFSTNSINKLTFCSLVRNKYLHSWRQLKLSMQIFVSHKAAKSRFIDRICRK